MPKIDHRRNYLIVLDTETANTLTDERGRLDVSSVLPYDIGWAVCDTRGNIYKTQSFVNKDIFSLEPELMESAYYACKLPRYFHGLATGERIMADTYTIRRAMLADMELYDTHIACAHNARFDINALNNIERWTTKSKYRYWFPYGTEIWDTLAMARSVIGKMPTYRKFCEENGYITKNGQLSMTAENLFRFISKNLEFEEDHMGLEDVLIEVQILRYCDRQHKAMKKRAFN